MPAELTGLDRDYLRVVLPACRSGKLERVRELLEDPRRFVEWTGPHGRTMVWEAARRGHLEVVRLLIEEHGADAKALGCYYRETRVEVSPWLAATLNGHEGTAEYLRKRRAGLDFLSACFLSDEPYVQKTLKKTPKKAQRSYVRRTACNPYQAWPLQYAIAGRTISIVRLLLEAGADPNADPQILYDATETEQDAIADLLVEGGADPSATQHRNWITKPRFKKIAKRHGIRLSAKKFPKEKWPAIVDACRGNHNAKDDVRRLEPFLKHGEDVNSRDYKGKTALHRASQAGFVEIGTRLLEAGANVEAASLEGETPLFDAAFYGKTELIRILADAGADLEATNHRGETAIFAGVRGGRAASVEALAELGASLEARNAKGKSLDEVAARSNKRGIEEVREALKGLGL